MNIVADEGVDEPIVSQLRKDGHDVWYVAEMAPSIPDEAVLVLANERNAPLLTADKDFGELIYRERRVATGIILLRLAGISPARKAAIVSSAIAEHAGETVGTFTVITPGAVRIRRQQ